MKQTRKKKGETEQQQGVKSSAIQKEQTQKARNSEIPWASLETLMILQGQFLHITVFPKRSYQTSKLQLNPT